MPIESLKSQLDVTPFSRTIRSGEGLALPIPEAGSAPKSEAAGAGPAGKSFGQMLQDAIGGVNAKQMRAADLTTRFAAGEEMDVHQVMIASQEAGTALSLALQVRNKVVEAYQEALRVSM